MASTNTASDHTPLTPRHRRWQDLRAWRLSLGLCVGPIVFAVIYVAPYMFQAGMTPGRMLPFFLTTLAYFIGGSIIAGWTYLLVVVRRRRKISRIECVLFGVALVDAVWLVSFAADDQQSLRAAINAALTWSFVTGTLFFSLAGLLHGWLFWRFGVQPSREDSTDAVAGRAHTLERSWPDLSTWRLSFGLSVGAVPPAILGLLLNTDKPLGETAVVVPAFLLALASWCLIGGWTYLLLISRRRGLIRRHDCLWLGVGLMELAIIVSGIFLWAEHGLDDFRGGVVGILIALVLMLLFGLLGGWLLWRVGVRPAPLEHDRTTSVFD